jgi:hypothetical protein
MLATILIVVMILLQTGALSLGLMVGRRFITAAAGSNRKSTLLNIAITGNGAKGGELGRREVLYAFSSTRGGSYRGGCSPRAS